MNHTMEYLENRGVALSLRLDGVPEVDIQGGGDVVTGDPYAFLLVATGRAEPATVGLTEPINVYNG